MDVTAPGELRISGFASAARAIGATIAFASPAVLENLVATAGEASAQDDENLARIRMVGTAGAPVPRQLLARAELVFPKASFHTPYGMTEVLPVTSAPAASLPAADSDRGVCVGKPLPHVDVEIRPIGATTTSIGGSLGPDALGEVYVRAAHGAAGYDRLWGRQHSAFVNGWHRSGDVGHLDEHGQLWIEGRVDDLIHGSGGTLTPVPIELEAESVAGVAKAAAVGIGPTGTQQLCVVVTGASGVTGGKGLIADATVTAAVRDAVSAPVAAVLVVDRLPVDRRHNSKLSRSTIRGWAEAVLRGDRPRRL
jgi:acyl-coenzyme A synthetase/AMP-(fatty) acid ligase